MLRTDLYCGAATGNEISSLWRNGTDLKQNSVNLIPVEVLILWYAGP